MARFGAMRNGAPWVVRLSWTLRPSWLWAFWSWMSWTLWSVRLWTLRGRMRRTDRFSWLRTFRNKICWALRCRMSRTTCSIRLRTLGSWISWTVRPVRFRTMSARICRTHRLIRFGALWYFWISRTSWPMCDRTLGVFWICRTLRSIRSWASWMFWLTRTLWSFWSRRWARMSRSSWAFWSMRTWASRPFCPSRAVWALWLWTWTTFRMYRTLLRMNCLRWISPFLFYFTIISPARSLINTMVRDWASTSTATRTTFRIWPYE